MRTLCYSVRLKSLDSISEKAYRAVSFDGSSAILPKTSVFGPDFSVSKSDAWWVAAWILEKKDIQYSRKKSCMFDDNGNQLPSFKIERHVPDTVHPVSDNTIESLRK